MLVGEARSLPFKLSSRIWTFWALIGGFMLPEFVSISLYLLACLSFCLYLSFSPCLYTCLSFRNLYPIFIFSLLIPSVSLFSLSFLSICLSVYLFVCLSICLSACFYVCLNMIQLCPFIPFFFCLYFCLSVRTLSIFLPAYLSAYILIYFLPVSLHFLSWSTNSLSFSLSVPKNVLHRQTREF